MKSLNTLKRFCALLLLMILLAGSSYASHIFGLDFYYTHVSGNTYKVNLVVYGDCSGSAFSSFPGSTPEVRVFNGGTLINTINLAVQPPAAGIEVTPVCPADIGNTTCVNPFGTIPGIKKFVYSNNVTLPGPSTVWRFVFTGNMGGGFQAGRSNSITNVLIGPGGSTIQLTDTLNNTVYNNNNAVYTTIPTPFYCINRPANFNPGAVDADGDSLRYNLVPGIEAATGSSVSYIAPYTATSPLGTAAGSYSFNNATGQLAFTPNITQKALVVYNVAEYRGGVLLGTSQREMTVVVIATCTNSAPGGVISSPSAGTQVGTNQINLCGNTGPFNFRINPTDADGDTITMTTSGLPAGATFNIVNNSTTAPQGTFSWNTTGVTPGNYTFFVTYQDRGCPLSNSQTIAYTVKVLPVPTATVTLVSPATCVAKAVFQVTPGGVTGPYTVTMLSGASTVHTFSGVTGVLTDSLAPGSYTVRVTNAENCFTDVPLALAAPVVPTLSATPVMPLCYGGSTGSVTATASGGSSPYSYALGSGAFGPSGSFTGLAAGTYTVRVRDANNCTATTAVAISNPAETYVHAGVRSPVCSGITNGQVSLTGYNSIAPYTYAMGSGSYSSTSLFSGLAPGTYTFHVKNANGCIKDTIITLTDSLTIGALITVDPILCNGGTAAVTVEGTGSIGYTYAYGALPFTGTGTFTLAAGSHTLHVRDANLCTYDTTITLTQPTAAVVTITTTAASCAGGDDGTATVAAIGGTPGYTYSIGGGAFVSSPVFTGLTAGTYTIKVRDANGCIYTTTATVGEPASIVIDSVRITRPLCFGSTNGSVQVFAHGGVAPYTYGIPPGISGSSSTISSLGAGIYMLYVGDANGCFKDTVITITQPAAIAASAVVKRPVCSTLANGMVMLNATGGTPAYTYAVGTGAYGSSATFTPLAAGSYLFHIRDANGCTKDTAITLTDSLVVTGTVTSSPVLCYGGATGSLTATGSGGTAPYTYALGSGSYGSSAAFAGLAAGPYTIQVRDNNGCVFSTGSTVSQPARLAATVAITPPTCYGSANGSVSVGGTGGVPAYEFSMNGGAFTTAATFSTLAAGLDTVSVRDANGCTRDTVITITQPAPLTITAMTATNVLCNGDNNGSVTVTAAGGVAPYSYAAGSAAWQSSNTLNGLGAGTYAIHVRDSNGCTKDTTTTITEPLPLIISAMDTVNPTCEGYTDGAITVHATGGTAPYNYSKDDITFSTDSAFLSLGEGNYTLYVRDANGCRQSISMALRGYPVIPEPLVRVTAATCHGYKDGSINVEATGGLAPLAVVVHSADTTVAGSTVMNTGAGVYTITVTDSKNCKKQTTAVVPAPAPLEVVLAVTDNLCEGYDNKGGVAANVTGGTAPYKYTWAAQPELSRQALVGMANGTYAVTITDSNNCSITDTARVKYSDCCHPFIPDAFTPNGDGKNDVFRIRYKGDMELLEFHIYNRFGEEVFVTKDPNSGWDGVYEGIRAELGVYFYFARIICGNNKDDVIMLKGDVTLVR